jgi:hypothetical protein
VSYHGEWISKATTQNQIFYSAIWISSVPVSGGSGGGWYVIGMYLREHVMEEIGNSNSFDKLCLKHKQKNSKICD